MSDDADKLAEISKQLPALDVDSTSAEMIARRARDSVGKGPPRRRLVWPLLVALFVTSLLIWAVINVLAVYR